LVLLLLLLACCCWLAVAAELLLPLRCYCCLLACCRCVCAAPRAVILSTHPRQLVGGAASCELGPGMPSKRMGKNKPTRKRSRARYKSVLHLVHVPPHGRDLFSDYTSFTTQPTNHMPPTHTLGPTESPPAAYLEGSWELQNTRFWAQGLESTPRANVTPRTCTPWPNQPPYNVTCMPVELGHNSTLVNPKTIQHHPHIDTTTAVRGARTCSAPYIPPTKCTPTTTKVKYTASTNTLWGSLVPTHALIFARIRGLTSPHASSTPYHAISPLHAHPAHTSQMHTTTRTPPHNVPCMSVELGHNLHHPRGLQNYPTPPSH
jgi:hypothetical protein